MPPQPRNKHGGNPREWVFLLRLFYGWSGSVLLVFGASLLILGVTSQPKDFLAYWSFDFGIVAYGFSLATLYFSDRDNENQSKELKRLADEVKALRERLDR